MLTLTLPFYSVLLLFVSTTVPQPYNATDRFFIDCGASYSTTLSDQIWIGDQNSEFVPKNINTTSLSITHFQLNPSDPQTPYSTARIFSDSSFTYTASVSQGPKFLRLHFYPATYSDLNLTPDQSFFSVSSNGFFLLTNFSAFLTASFLTKTRAVPVTDFVKEYMIYVKDTQILNVTFTPEPNSYAFINGIEIVSMPENLYFNVSKNPKPVGMTTGPVVTSDMALENMYRLNMGGKQISGNEDTGMYRTWDQDNIYIFGASIGLTPDYEQTPITYTTETPNYTAPKQLYQTHRSMDNQFGKYNLTWILPVDSGFYYQLRLHFCNIIPQYKTSGQVVFKIFINNQMADGDIDLFHLTQDSGYPVYKDYVVFVDDPDGSGGKQDLWLAMHPNPKSEPYHDAYLNGLEVFKLSLDRSLVSPNPELKSTTVKRNRKKPPYAVIIGCACGALVMLCILVPQVYKIILLLKISYYSSVSNPINI